MALNPAETRVAGTGTVYIASYGAPLPTAWNSALPSSWHDLGYTDEDGVTFTDEPTIDRKGAWQSLLPVRILETGRAAKAAFKLQQFNTQTLTLAAGGGTVTDAGTGRKFTPHTAGQIAEWSFVVDVTDGDLHDRYVIERCVVVSGLDTNMNRSDMSLLPVELEAVDPDGGDPWYMFTNDTAGFA